MIRTSQCQKHIEFVWIRVPIIRDVLQLCGSILPKASFRRTLLRQRGVDCCKSPSLTECLRDSGQETRCTSLIQRAECDIEGVNVKDHFLGVVMVSRILVTFSVIVALAFPSFASIKPSIEDLRDQIQVEIQSQIDEAQAEVDAINDRLRDESIDLTPSERRALRRERIFATIAVRRLEGLLRRSDRWSRFQVIWFSRIFQPDDPSLA